MSDRDYVKQLGELLRKGDPLLLREYLVERSDRFCDPMQAAELRARTDDDMAQLMHHMILARTDLTDLHAASARWLAEHQASQPPARPRRRRP